MVTPKQQPDLVVVQLCWRKNLEQFKYQAAHRKILEFIGETGGFGLGLPFIATPPPPLLMISSFLITLSLLITPFVPVAPSLPNTSSLLSPHWTRFHPCCALLLQVGCKRDLSLGSRLPVCVAVLNHGDNL